jgi:hypothetical protein
MKLAGRRAFRSEIVTGERLQALAGVSVVPGHVRRFHRHLDRHAAVTVDFEEYGELDDTAIAQIARQRTIFVYTHELDAFIEHVWPRLDGGPYVLMTHNSDGGVDASRLPWLEHAGDRLERWYAQNLELRHGKLEPLPIGIANSMWPHGDLRALARVRSAPKDELVFLAFSPGTHPARRQLWESLRSAFPELPAQAPAPRGFRPYLADLARHRYCVCPRGNGIDTHRVWECLYLGVVPIVERSVHTDLWAERGLPLLQVDDWQEVEPAFLAGLDPVAPSPDLDLLRLSHYRELLAGRG